MTARIERRVFGAIEFIDDLTNARVLAPLALGAPGLRLLRNRLGLYVIQQVEGEDGYSRAFEAPPPAPMRRDFRLSVCDPQQRYLPQAFTLALPRMLPSEGAPVAEVDHALRPVPIRLYPAAGLTLRRSWAVLRLSVQVAGSAPPVGLANVVVEASPQVAGLAPRHALTDAYGEALLVIQGAPAILPDAALGGAAGLSRQFKLALQLLLDPAIVVRSDAAEIPLPDLPAVLARRAAGVPGLRVVAAPEQLLSAGSGRRHLEMLSWP